MSAFPDESKPASARAARHYHAGAVAPHGTEVRYQAGCSCVPCKAEHRRYNNARYAEQRRGDYQPRPRGPSRKTYAQGTTLAELLEEW